MSELDCGEGMMRGLDGACVKKFVIPKTKLECPKLSVDNGEIFLIGEIFAPSGAQGDKITVRLSYHLFEALLKLSCSSSPSNSILNTLHTSDGA